MLNEERLKSLLDEDKKNLFAMDVINAASIFLHAYENEEKLAEMINSGEFVPNIVGILGETNSRLCKMYAKEDELADKLRGSEEERLEYLRTLETDYWIIIHKLARGVRLTNAELGLVEVALKRYEKSESYPNSDDQAREGKDNELPWD